MAPSSASASDQRPASKQPVTLFLSFPCPASDDREAKDGERERECDSAAFPQALVAALKATSSSALQIWQVPPQCKSCCAKPASKGEAHTLPVRRWTCTGSHTEISKSVHGQASTLDRKQNVFRSSRSLRTGSLNLPQNLKAPTPSHNCALARLELQVYSSKCLQLGQRSLQVLSMAGKASFGHLPEQIQGTLPLLCLADENTKKNNDEGACLQIPLLFAGTDRRIASDGGPADINFGSLQASRRVKSMAACFRFLPSIFAYLCTTIAERRMHRTRSRLVRM